jgi:hypothetical protein
MHSSKPYSGLGNSTNFDLFYLDISLIIITTIILKLNFIYS